MKITNNQPVFKILVKTIISLALIIFGTMLIKGTFSEYYQYIIQAAVLVAISFGVIGLYSIFAKTTVTGMFAVSGCVALAAYGYVMYFSLNNMPTEFPLPFYWTSALYVHLCAVAVSTILFFAYKKIYAFISEKRCEKQESLITEQE